MMQMCCLRGLKLTCSGLNTKLLIGKTLSQSPLSTRKIPSSYNRIPAINSKSRTETARENVPQNTGNNRPGYKGQVSPKQHSARLDSYLSDMIPEASRAKVQSAIKGGHVSVNGEVQVKPASAVRTGDYVECQLAPPVPLHASPEPIPLDIVFEDDYLIVVNKPPHLVVHPSPGHYSGTLVNALLHHCRLPAIAVPPEWSADGSKDASMAEDVEDEDVEDSKGALLSVTLPLWGPAPVLRPGIVHRLDKGTSGLLVVAKDEVSHARLCEQFAERTVERQYVSMLCKAPREEQWEGRVETLIGRDPRERKRMAVVGAVGRGAGPAKQAASRYKVTESLAGGLACVCEWKLETGRTHQIRVHARHLGHAVLGDDMYGGSGKGLLATVGFKAKTEEQARLADVLTGMSRPCLHAEVLGFVHPHSGQRYHFSVPPPPDFCEVLEALKAFS